MGKSSDMSRSSEKNKYYTVPEFAALAGVSKQAVYDRIKKDLGGFTIKQGGKTLISEEALCMVGSGAVVCDAEDQFDETKVNQVESSQSSQVLSQSSQSSQSSQASQALDRLSQEAAREVDLTGGVSKVESSSQESRSSGGKVDTGFLEYLIKENARLIVESERKDAVIAEKDKELHTYYERVMGLTEQLASLAEREQDIASKALSTTGQAQLLHAMSGDQSEVVTMVQGNALADETPPEKPKKSPWWKRKGK